MNSDGIYPSSWPKNWAKHMQLWFVFRTLAFRQWRTNPDRWETVQRAHKGPAACLGGISGLQHREKEIPGEPRRQRCFEFARQRPREEREHLRWQRPPQLDSRGLISIFVWVEHRRPRRPRKEPPEKTEDTSPSQGWEHCLVPPTRLEKLPKLQSTGLIIRRSLFQSWG